MLNINASVTTLQLQLVFFVKPTDPMGKLADVPHDPGHNSLVVIPLAWLRWDVDDDARQKLSRCLLAIEGLLVKLASTETDDEASSWADSLYVPAKAQSFSRLLSPTTQLWESSVGKKLVVKTYDYYLRAHDGVNTIVNILDYRRSPLPERVLADLAEINPEYKGWKLDTLLYDEAGKTPLIQHVRYPFVEGSHWPHDLGQFGSVLDLTLRLHTRHNIVFADMLLRNIVFAVDNKTAMLIDFDLSGEARVDTYPPGYNVEGDLAPYRHPCARPKKKMETIHDCYALAAMARKLWPGLTELYELLLAGKLAEASTVCHSVDKSRLRPESPNKSELETLKPGANGTGSPRDAR
jgi:hypothetical protein